MRLLKCMAATAVAALALAASASAATTVSVTANPTQGGTTASPVAESLTINTTIDNNGAAPNPIPVGQTASLVQTLPKEFASQLSRFGSCPESSFAGGSTAPGGPEDPTVACPANSLVGNGSLKLVAQAGPNTIVANSDKVVIVNTTGGLAFWVSYSVVGTRISKVFHGTVGTNGSGQTSISWDPTPAEPTAPIAVKLLEFNTSYNANQSALQTVEPFANTGCAGGSWAFSVENTFVGGSPASQTVSASVACGAGSSPAANTAAPKIEGTARAGQSLTESDGTWTGNPAPTLSRQWRLCDSAGNNCSDIAGATGNSYTVQSGDVGHTIRVVVKGTNASGSASATSAPTAVVPGGTASVKTKTVTVSAKGKGQVKLKCGSTGPCAGNYEIAASKKGKKVVLAKGKYSVGKGKTGKLSFKLTSAGKKQLQGAGGSLSSKLKLKPTQGKTVTSSLKLKSAS